MSATLLAPTTRQGSRHRPDPKYASGCARHCRSHDRASAQVRAGELRARVGGSRFLEVDPIEGGSCNDYDYVAGDPVNNLDLAGTFCIGRHCVHAPKLVKKVIHQTMRAAAFAAYVPYFAGNKMNRWAARGGGSRVFKAPLRPLGWAMQGAGIPGDVAIDRLKNALCCKESIYDEHTRGSINPFHNGGEGNTFLPGLYKNDRGQTRLDWAW